MSGNITLEIKNLTKIYNKGINKELKALDNISLKIKKGAFFALLGPNGAGKSTLINCLGTIVKKTSGKIIVSGYDLDTQTFLAKKSIGIVFQELNFDPYFTPLQLLMLQQGLYGLTPNKNFCIHILNLLGLKGKENSNIRALSGGMKRRVLIAKALVHSPDIVVLDEPTAGVDVELRKIIWNRLIELNNSGTTIILTTHYLEEAQYLCKEIAIVNKGKLIANEETSKLIGKLGTKMLKAHVKDPQKLIPESIKKYFNACKNNILEFIYTLDNENGFIISELIKNGFTINNISSKEADLEEVFLKLIGNNN